MDWKIIKNDLRNRNIFPYMLMLIAFSLPLRMQTLPLLTILAFLSWLISKDLKTKFNNFLRNKYSIIIATLFMVGVIGLLNSQNLTAGFKTLEIKLSYIILPLLVLSSPEYMKRREKLISKAFIAGNVTGALICVVIAFINAYNNALDGELFNFDVYNNIYKGQPFFKLLFSGYSYFNYSYLSILIHVNYFSMYIALALYMQYRQILQKYILVRKINYHNILTLLFLLMILILLQSRAATLSFIVAALFESIYHILKPGYKKLKIIAVVFMLTLMMIVFTKSERFSRVLKSIDEISFNQLKQDNLRLMLWEEAVILIKNNWLFGVGTGDINDEFKKVYSKKLYDASGKRYLNFHNEFLETWGMNGVFAFIVLMLLLFLPFYSKRNYNHNRELLILCIILTINFIFESLLVRLNGVIFFALFYSLFSINETHYSTVKQSSMLG